VVFVKKKKRVSKIKLIERFATRQLQKYVKIHKEHEKDLDYIG